MKKNYFFTLLILGLTLLSNPLFSQIKMVWIDPVDETVIIKNFGSSTVDVSSYWMCSLLAYQSLSTVSIVNGTDFLLEPNEEVKILVTTISFNDSAADIGLYSSSAFGSSVAIVDFFQYGNSGLGREDVAANAGLWSAGDFFSGAGPYVFTGSASDTGLSAWQSTLSTSSERLLAFEMFPNPSSDMINIQLPAGTDNAKATLFDYTGRLVVAKELNIQDTGININNLANGIYVVRVESQEKVGTQKFIKN